MYQIALYPTFGCWYCCIMLHNQSLYIQIVPGSNIKSKIPLIIIRTYIRIRTPDRNLEPSICRNSTWNTRNENAYLRGINTISLGSELTNNDVALTIFFKSQKNCFSLVLNTIISCFEFNNSFNILRLMSPN